VSAGTAERRIQKLRALADSTPYGPEAEAAEAEADRLEDALLAAPAPQGSIRQDPTWLPSIKEIYCEGTGPGPESMDEVHVAAWKAAYEAAPARPLLRSSVGRPCESVLVEGPMPPPFDRHGGSLFLAESAIAGSSGSAATIYRCTACGALMRWRELCS